MSGETADTGPVAPRTPNTDKIYDCLNSANQEAKLTNDIAVNALNQAKAAYDAALEESANAGGNVEEKRAEVAKLKADVDFLEIQLENARARKPQLELRFQEANTKALSCSNSDDACTIAEKEIYVLTSNSAAEAVQENIREINQYIEDIASQTETYNIKNDAFAGIEAGAQPVIQAAKDKEEEEQLKYVEAKERQDRTQKDFDELHDACKLEAFHENQETLHEIRENLERYGITIELQEAVVTDPDTGLINGGGDTSTTDTSGWDCRYKQLEPCQGIKLKNSTDTQKELCRVQITPTCFNQTYESNWELDLWSFIFLAPAIVACVFEEEFAYGLCVDKAAYILNLKYLQDELGIRY